MVKKYNAVIKDNIATLIRNGHCTGTFLPRCILVICQFLRPIWLLSTIPLTSLFSFVLTFCLSVCIQFVYSIVATCTGHYPVLLGAVCVTGTEPRKEVESVSECTVNGRMHAI